MSGLQLQRLGLMMQPEPGKPLEIEGVRNTAAARDRDGQLCLFPRLTTKGNDLPPGAVAGPPDIKV